MDPSRNMAKYRNLINSEHVSPPYVSQCIVIFLKIFLLTLIYMICTVSVLIHHFSLSQQIPFYPIFKKDLYFIHLGNDATVDSLINFEKLRMIAKEIRHMCNICSTKYVSPFFLFSLKKMYVI